jgi:sterol desaturase/sphingolipid hydroxylase (fatty acid hydroxylase superfamily)
MNIKSKFSIITILLATIVGISLACYGISSIADKYYRANLKLGIYEESVQGWEACRQMKPEFYSANTEAISSSLENYHQAQQDFWVILPKSHLVIIYVLVGLAGAIGGYTITWTIIWFCGYAVYDSVKWCILGMHTHTGRNVKNLHYQHHS